MTAASTDATGAPGRSSAELPCVPESVGRARAFVTGVLTGWGMEGDLSDCGEAIVSELLTNVVDHTGTDLTEVAVERRGDGSVRIEVTDRSQSAPRLGKAADDAECGRGLSLVDALSACWGYDAHPDGKVTWAEIKIPTGGAR
ncbi:ATP-binding protein [Streptomyces sp. CAI-85]|uniref:ATP-binding protein n=1 Tax=Streptomyces sp. CAI-85 TaxID=1472662 RepID=UPI001587A44A|nr:ATP-binding protein [Streptomyces sp. CAI-85]NUV58928.1 ATP-binding protein [Streptomyces sp. CAI-85]